MTVTKIKRQIHSCILTSRHAKVVGLSPTILILNINLTCNQMWVLPATNHLQSRWWQTHPIKVMIML